MGQKLTLSCQGFDEISIKDTRNAKDTQGTQGTQDTQNAKDTQNTQGTQDTQDTQNAKDTQGTQDTQERYELVNDKGDSYFLNLLQVKKDNPMTKEFIVTPYRVYKGSLVLTLKDKISDKKLFRLAINDIKVNSVIQNKADAQIVGPYGPSWVLFNPLEFVLLIVALLMALSYSIFKTYKRQKLKKEYKKTMTMVNYEDPFLDLNVDLSDIERNQKKVKNLEPHMELALKKFFYHFFKKPVFFDTPSKMNHELKKLKMREHDMRAIGVIKNDYQKILDNVSFDIEAKRDFIQSAKKNLNRLKRYSKRYSEGYSKRYSEGYSKRYSEKRHSEKYSEGYSEKRYSEGHSEKRYSQRSDV